MTVSEINKTILGSVFHPKRCTYMYVCSNPFLTCTQRYRLAKRLAGHTGPINCFAFACDGERLASGGKDEMIETYGALNSHVVRR
jgi:WD40 repeat protein